MVNNSASFSNLSATPAAFQLLGGTYGITVSATFGAGSVTLNVLAGDNITWIAVLTAFAAVGYAYLSLPPGQYQLAIATATAVYAAIAPIKGA
jgi:hypothetical protein